MGFFFWFLCTILVVALVLLLFPFSVRIDFEAGERSARALFFFFKKKVYEYEKKWGKDETKDDKCVDRGSDCPKTDSANVEIGDIEVEGADSLINIGDFAKSGFKAKKPWFDKGIDVYNDSVHGPIFAYISYQNRDKDGHAHFDIAVSDTNKNQASITYLVDAVYP